MRTRAPLATAALAALLATTTTLAGCGSGSPPSPPSGVDQLVVPTPDPDADDFVEVVDNPWFPLLPGTRWEYDVPRATTETLVVEVAAGPEVAGVATTDLVRTSADGTVVRDHYAQDTAGNVWWFGREGEWTAGVDGAEAGLAMPADPRRGDGFVTGRSTSGDEVATVERLDGGAVVPQGEFDDTVELEVRDAAGLTRREVYARGVGLVLVGETALVDLTRPE
ncbi:hypothetical protein L615_000100000430 [Nocardioides sp. J9]|uniref:hypothetical protein n=1 Tax=Nocardioides sp. J9 TaxID=935844 RepID=UPI0011AA586F|nr:hypothetical protein [Nocardioides sp. J9]TWH04888.1 hypothetical protein L615_000100000430 [Nocardioides sp. J9]